ncbi:hypothetical protein [Siansivirga zeaxanthinifaciens]|uniref:hypothetical protein n=1 Tax=Siansivirga zeaxanthinifaciens TaxID=762954 RepID=UPI0026AF420A|nr:hypothetical protein [Siansivirga zeaxanthinifaciens]
METITKVIALIVLSLSVQFIQAQDTIQKTNNEKKIAYLNNLKDQINEEERNFLKEEVEAINVRL